MDQVAFTVDKQPVPASRPKVAKFGVYYPKSHTEYREWLMKELKTLPEFPTEGVVEARLLFVMPPYKGSDYPTHRADTDNLSKLPFDCMTKSVTEAGQPRYWKDDNLIVSHMAFKRFCRAGESPHTKVRILSIDEDISDYVDRMFYQ